jgi:hypothetical protein
MNRTTKITKRHTALAIQWMSGDIGLHAVADKLGIKHGHNALPSLAVYLREAYRLGLITQHKDV